MTVLKSLRTFFTRSRLVLALVAGSTAIWIQCGSQMEPTSIPSPPQSDSTSPDPSLTDDSATETRIRAATSVADRDEIATVNAARRFEAMYGSRWREVVSAWRAVWLAQGKVGLISKSDALLDTNEVDRLNGIVPVLTEAQKDARAILREQKWADLRNKIAQRGTAQLPPTYRQLQQVPPAQKADASITSAQRALEHLTNRSAMASGGGPRATIEGVPLLAITPLVGMLQNNCFANCQSLADDLIELLYEICLAAYHSCCDDIGPCYAGSSAREICYDEYSECTDEAVEDYYDWYDRCTDRC